MKRAIWLIVTLTLLSVGGGLWCDITQRDAARGYLAGVNEIREMMLAGDEAAAARETRYRLALWQHDEHWLNCLIDHHHTRAVSAALRKLDTALAHGWTDEALRALDEAEDAFEDVEGSDFAAWENVL